MILELCFILTLFCAPGSSHNRYDKDPYFTPRLIQSFGYPVEIHNVTTADNYIVTLHRIPWGVSRDESPRLHHHNHLRRRSQSYEKIFLNSFKNSNIYGSKVISHGKPAILLVHGFLSSSFAWVVLGPGNSLAFLLADRGFDVWMLNTRGTISSRGHTYFPWNSKDYWNFSYHENGVYDVPATIDYILDISGQSKLDYIGFSMGASDYFIAMSEKPHYSQKIRRVAVLSPTPINKYADPGLMCSINGENIVQKTIQGIMNHGISFGEFPPFPLQAQKLLSDMCQPKSPLSMLTCPQVLIAYSGSSTTNANKNLLPFILMHELDTTSYQLVNHFCQKRISGRFCPFDYGEKLNLQIYGLPSPPAYDFSRSINPVYIFWSENDKIGHPKDIAILREKLPNVQLYYKIADPSYTHRDFVWASSVRRQVNEKVIEVFTK